VLKTLKTFIKLHLWFDLVNQFADDTKIYGSCRPNSSAL